MRVGLEKNQRDEVKRSAARKEHAGYSQIFAALADESELCKYA